MSMIARTVLLGEDPNPPTLIIQNTQPKPEGSTLQQILNEKIQPLPIDEKK